MVNLFAVGKRRNIDAKAIMYSDDNILVLKGSKISTTTGNFKMTKEAKAYRTDKSLLDDNNILIKDLKFKSLSSAAQYVTGHSVNGKIFWKEKKK